MVRWEPGTRERLQAAALELFASRGYEQVTAAEIAQAVGLTERTFFRNFSDKREVLFHGQELFLQAFVDGIDQAPADASPLELITAALHGAASFFPDERRPYSRLRQTASVFGISFTQWIREGETRSMPDIAADVLGELRVLIGAADRPAVPS
jgi:AcrR family transcriptional regulator